MADPNEMVVKSIIEDGWNSHDPSRLKAHYAKNVSFWSPLAGHIDSLEGVVQFASGLYRAFPDAHMEVTRVISAGTDAFVHFKATGTNTGPLPNGMAATGRPMEFKGLAHMVIKDGLAYQDWVYYDALGLFRQLGLVPGP